MKRFLLLGAIALTFIGCGHSAEDKDGTPVDPRFSVVWSEDIDGRSITVIRDAADERCHALVSSVGRGASIGVVPCPPAQ